MREFLSFVNGTSMASSSNPLHEDDDDTLGFVVKNLERWGDRRVPRRYEDRGELLLAPRPGWPYS